MKQTRKQYKGNYQAYLRAWNRADKQYKSAKKGKQVNQVGCE